MIVNELHVRLGDVTVGTLAHLSGDRITLIFDSDYLNMRNRPVLGLSFLNHQGGVIEEQRITTRKAPPYFANLLPEGHLRDYLAGLAGVNEARDYPLLYLTGGDLPGAVRLIPGRAGPAMKMPSCGAAVRTNPPCSGFPLPACSSNSRP